MNNNIYVLKDKTLVDYNIKCRDIVDIYFEKYYKVLNVDISEGTKFIRENYKKNIAILLFMEKHLPFKNRMLQVINLLKGEIKCKFIIYEYDYWKTNAIYYCRRIISPYKFYLLLDSTIDNLNKIRCTNKNNLKDKIFKLAIWSVYKLAECDFNNNPIDKILISGRINIFYPERLKLSNIKSKYIEIYNYNIKQYETKNNNFNQVLNKYLCCFTSSVYVRNISDNYKKTNTHILLLKVFEILGSGSLLLYPKHEEEYVNNIGLFHKKNCWLLDFTQNINEQINYIMDIKNRKEINTIRKNGWEHGIKNLNSYNKFLEIDKIIKEILNK